MKMAKTGAAVASAVALMFLASAAIAQDGGSISGGSTASAPAKVKCVGANDCKGKSACKSAENSCKGQNSCKGKGFVETSSTQECQQMGGKPMSM